MPSASAVQDEVTLLRELVSTLQKEKALLRQKVEALIRRVFGSSSERIDPAQLELLLQLTGGLEAPKAEAPAPKQNPPNRRALRKSVFHAFPKIFT